MKKLYSIVLVLLRLTAACATDTASILHRSIIHEIAKEAGISFEGAKSDE